MVLNCIFKTAFLPARKSTLLMSVLMLIFFTGCTPEIKLAKTYVKTFNKIPALVFMPKMVFKYNLKTDSIDLTGLSDAEKDSLLWFNSDFIQYIDDSLFISSYQHGYLTALKQYGIIPFTEKNMDDFFANDSGGFVVNVAQIELEEQYYPYVDEMNLDGITYSHHHLLNALDVSSWFELKFVDNPDTTETLFAETMLTDDFEGFFEQNPFSLKIQYFYHLDSLTVEKIYNYADDLGKIYASYTYDYLLNKYLKANLSATGEFNGYLHYDPVKKAFIFAGNDRFVPLDE
jgi:hypothetical protein